jgi:hypothetical protein
MADVRLLGVSHTPGSLRCFRRSYAESAQRPDRHTVLKVIFDMDALSDTHAVVYHRAAQDSAHVAPVQGIPGHESSVYDGYLWDSANFALSSCDAPADTDAYGQIF